MKKVAIFPLLGLLAVFGLCGTGIVVGDDDEYEHRVWWGGPRQDVGPVDNVLYREECGSCHFAYQPGLLPSESWQRLMAGLENHFEENGEFEAEARDEISRYLEANAADSSTTGRSSGFASHSDSLRISDSRYFRRQHHEIPARWVEKNPEVGSFAYCDVCHTTAEQGNYDEHAVRIPGVGRWDD